MRAEFVILRHRTWTKTITPTSLADALTEADKVTDPTREEADIYRFSRMRYHKLTGLVWGNVDTTWDESDHTVRTVQLDHEEWVWRCSCGAATAPQTFRSEETARTHHEAHVLEWSA